MRVVVNLIVCKLNSKDKTVSFLLDKEDDKLKIFEKELADNKTLAETSSELLKEKIGYVPTTCISMGLIDELDRNTNERELASVSIIVVKNEVLTLNENVVELNVEDIVGTKWVKDHEKIIKATLVNLLEKVQ